MGLNKLQRVMEDFNLKELKARLAVKQSQLEEERKVLKAQKLLKLDKELEEQIAKRKLKFELRKQSIDDEVETALRNTKVAIFALERRIEKLEYNTSNPK